MTMQLTGMLDSPFVRRVAVALLKWGLPFTHRPVSLFRHIDAFTQINPMLKAPTLTVGGVALMESNVILEYLAAANPGLPGLWPADPAARLAAARLAGVALTLGEKAVQLHYERMLRPPEAQHEPWRARVALQFDAAVKALEAELPKAGWIGGGGLGHADIAVTCMAGFARAQFPERLGDVANPNLLAFCARAEALPEFLASLALDGASVAFPS